MFQSTVAEERANFSERLKSAAGAAHVPWSPSGFARAFNVRAGGDSVTSHGVRKWMVGESIPTQGKIVILAAWLGVSSAWLRFGEGEAKIASATVMSESAISTADLAMLRAIASLPEPARQAIRDIVEVMAHNFSAKKSH